jgi:hypothetical protein
MSGIKTNYDVVVIGAGSGGLMEGTPNLAHSF